jgi:hypothetical protein
MRERYANGETTYDIAATIQWSQATVNRHVSATCSHDTPSATECVVDRPHLTQTPPRNARLAVDAPEEAYCRDCNARVTIGPDGTEYGHRTEHADRYGRCPNRPAAVDAGGVSSPQ